MNEDRQRKLAAILFADIVGYTAMMQKDEALARRTLSGFHAALKEKVPAHRGEIINDYGDGCLIIFDSAVEATNCALALQREFISEPQVPVRIGLHSGDVFFDQNNVYGDAVNLASRIESLGVPGSVLFSETIRAQIHNKPEFEFKSLGQFDFKNVDRKMEVFALKNVGLPIPKRAQMQGKLKGSKNKSIPYIFGGVLASLLVIVFLLSPWGPYGQVAYAKTLAVLPFDTNSSDESDALLADEIGAEVRKVLAEQSGIGLTDDAEAAAALKDVSAQQAGEALKVAQVLEGDIKRDGDRVYVTVRMVRTSDGTILWTDTYEGTADDKAALQRNIVSDVSSDVPAAIEKERKSPSPLKPAADQPSSSVPPSEKTAEPATDPDPAPIPEAGASEKTVTFRALGPDGEPVKGGFWEIDNRGFAETRWRRSNFSAIVTYTLPTGRYKIMGRNDANRQEHIIDITADGPDQFDYTFIDGTVKFIPKLSEGSDMLSGVYNWKFFRKAPDGSRERLVDAPGDDIRSILPVGDYYGLFSAGAVKHRFEFSVKQGETLERDIIINAGIAKIGLIGREDSGFAGIAVHALNGDKLIADLAGNRGKRFIVPAGRYEARATVDGKVRSKRFAIRPGERKSIVLDFGKE